LKKYEEILVEDTLHRFIDLRIAWRSFDGSTPKSHFE
jgi:hypothetical protein